MSNFITFTTASGMNIDLPIERVMYWSMKPAPTDSDGPERFTLEIGAGPSGFLGDSYEVLKIAGIDAYRVALSLLRNAAAREGITLYPSHYSPFAHFKLNKG